MEKFYYLYKHFPTIKINKMAYLKINWSINKSGTEEIDLEDLGFTSEEWESLTDEEIQTFILEMFEEEDLMAYPIVEGWEIVQKELPLDED